MNTIFDSYQSDKPDLEYRIERFGDRIDEIEKNNDFFLFLYGDPSQGFTSFLHPELLLNKLPVIP